jgi:hypothetical protein
MIPKEKAIELVDKYKNISISFVDSIEGTCDTYINNEDAKECALIAVNEILKDTKLQDLTPYQHGRTAYWQEVKQEIEKL